MDRTVQGDKPREKLKKFGVERLTDRELVQLLLGSGSGGNRLSVISKKVLGSIKNLNADMSYQNLEAIPGLGPAKIGQLLATFELASRYPLKKRTILLDSVEKVKRYHQHSSARKSTVLTMDGAGYLISERNYSVDSDISATELLRYAVRDIGNDQASRVVLLLRTQKRSVAPLMSSLMIARDLKQIGKLLGFSVGDVIVEQNGMYYPVLDRMGRH